ncbi:MAG: L-threonylcarbamoyladenylate synthase [Pseudomonadota bacterium]|nr:L-threonylcarbamoyladenylate synthase [Pseudomonadota bacterium]|tara:strand:- start:336 stop:914 length:579 start_codon:yes stop_codon:yes gene_type:complete
MTVVINPSAPEEYEDISNAIVKGKIVAYPTESVFGIGCDPENEKSINKIIAIKNRSKQKGLIIIADEVKKLSKFIHKDYLDLFIKKSDIESKPTTWIVPSSKHVLNLVKGEDSSVALRITQHPIASRICKYSNKAIISTSANISSKTPAKNSNEILMQFGEEIDIIVDGRVGDSIKPTQIVDLITNKVIRES